MFPVPLQDSFVVKRNLFFIKQSHHNHIHLSLSVAVSESPVLDHSNGGVCVCVTVWWVDGGWKDLNSNNLFFLYDQFTPSNEDKPSISKNK